MRAHRTFLEGGIVLAGYTVLACLLTWPLALRLGSSLIGDSSSDAAGTVAWLWQLQHEGGFHVFGSIDHTLTGAPFGWEESNNVNFQWLLPYYLAYLFSTVIGEVAAYNLLLLSGYVLSGASMYLLVRYLRGVPLVAAWSGVVFVIFPWHVERAVHPSLLHLEVLVFVVLAVLAAAERPSWLRFSLVGLATLVCWLTSGYFGTMAMIGATALALGAALASRRERRFRVAGGSVVAALVASVLVAVIASASGTGRDAGLNRVAGDLSSYGIRPLELVVPTRESYVFGSWLASVHDEQLHQSNRTEASNYLGLLTIGLAIAWLIIAWRRRRMLDERQRGATVGLLVLFAAALVLTVPSPLKIFGHELWMPARLLWEIIPAFRVPSRWIALAMAGLVPLAALALQAAWRKVQGSSRSRAAPVIVVAAATILSLVELLVPVPPPRGQTEALPPEYRGLAGIPRGVLARYPVMEVGSAGFWQRLHGRPILNGGTSGTPVDAVRRVLLHPGVPGAASSLALLGVTALLAYPDALEYRDDVSTPLPLSLGPGYRLVTRTSDGSTLWRVVAPPAPALATLPSGFEYAEPPNDGFVGYPLVSPAGVGYIELRAKAAGVLRLSFDALPPGGSQRSLRVADAEGERAFALDGRTAVSLLVAVPQGISQLLVKTDPPATSTADAIQISAPRTERADGPADLHSEAISSSPGF